MKKKITPGSLFDGAGTFPFAAQQCGVKAVWATEWLFPVFSMLWKMLQEF